MGAIRWKRFGHDRVYVKNETGDDIGWWDLATDEAHPADPSLFAALSFEVMQWRAAQSSAEQPTAPDRPPAPDPASPWDAAPQAPHVAFAPPTGPPVRDLLENRAGEQLHVPVLQARERGEAPTLLRRVLLGKNASSSWERGLNGEVLVAKELARLCDRDPRWGFLQSLEVGDKGSDIDFLVMGPGGFFTLNAKHHAGANIWVAGNVVMVNGNRYPYIRNSRHEAERAGRLLTRALGSPVIVSGLIVPVNARS